jgi:hypothetical protein
MWTNFPDDATTLSQDGQYMWSDSLLFTPVLTEGATDVTGYFPKSLWYSITDDGLIDATQEGKTATFDTPMSTTNVHIRGGSIVPMQNSGMTTKAVKESPFTLLVALDSTGSASGSLFLDDGVQNELSTITYVEYTLEVGNLVSSVAAGSSYETTLALETIEIRGVDRVYGTACTAELTTQPLDGDAQTFTPVTSVVNVGEFYSTFTVTFDGVQVASDYVLSFDCSEDSDDDDGIFSDVYVQVVVSLVVISCFVALLFLWTKMRKASMSKCGNEEALLDRNQF